MDELKNLAETAAPADALLYGALRFAGADARAFLQGQLTHDLRLLTRERPLLAAHCTPQGRVVAIVTLIEDGEDVVALLPTPMVTPLHERLRKYLLRSKVKITDASDRLPQLSAAGELATLTQANANEWRLAQIAAGRPQIYPETTELFVAQMLNLDLIDAISFEKGCYTGQEIVARAHYRGQVKRRMLRYRTVAPGGLRRGETVRIDAGRTGRIVELATLPDGRCEFLAVVPLASAESAMQDAPAAEQTAVESLPLPYELPQSL